MPIRTDRVPGDSELASQAVAGKPNPTNLRSVFHTLTRRSLRGGPVLVYRVNPPLPGLHPESKLARMVTLVSATESSGACDTHAPGAPQSTLHLTRTELTRDPGKSDPECMPLTPRVRTDAKLCRTKAIALADYAACLVERSFQDPQALSFGCGSCCQAWKPSVRALRRRKSCRDARPFCEPEVNEVPVKRPREI